MAILYLFLPAKQHKEHSSSKDSGMKKSTTIRGGLSQLPEHDVKASEVENLLKRLNKQRLD